MRRAPELEPISENFGAGADFWPTLHTDASCLSILHTITMEIMANILYLLNHILLFLFIRLQILNFIFTSPSSFSNSYYFPQTKNNFRFYHFPKSGQLVDLVTTWKYKEMTKHYTSKATFSFQFNSRLNFTNLLLVRDLLWCGFTRWTCSTWFWLYWLRCCELLFRSRLSSAFLKKFEIKIDHLLQIIFKFCENFFLYNPALSFCFDPICPISKF